MQQKIICSDLSERTLGDSLSRLSRYWWCIWKRTPHYHPRKLIPYLSAFAFILAMLPGPDVRASMRLSHEEWLPVEAIETSSLEGDALDYVLQRGDVSSKVLQNMGFSYQDVLDMDAASRKTFSFKKIRAGHRLQRKDLNGIIHVWYDVDAQHRLQLQKKEGTNWQASMQPRPLQYKKVHTFGVIEDSLFIDALKAGMDDRTTMALTDVFAWDIDFARNLRKGDRFKVHYEEGYDDHGQLISSSILAAEFINRGKTYVAVRYTDKKGKTGYYSLTGTNLQKDFLKAPLKFSRISSRFSHARKHPILGYTRAHKGIDYAAPSGTAIHAVGDGKIVVAGRNRGYGRYVRIRHKNGVTTAYGHLRRYGKGVRKGKHVRQGAVIGYVGMSGLATGPHLHFEYRVKGKAVNPLRVRREAGEPISKREMARFKQSSNLVHRSLKAVALRKQADSWG